MNIRFPHIHQYRLKHPYSCSTRRGLTLVEALIALALFALAGGVLMQTCANTLRSIISVTEMDNHGQQFRFAIRQIVRIGDRDELESGGELTCFDGGRISWQAEVEETEIVDLYKVTLNITLSSDDYDGLEPEERSETLYLLRLGWADPRERDTILREKREALRDRRTYGF